LSGAVVARLDAIGVATVSGLSASGAAELAAIPGIRAVERTVMTTVSHSHGGGADDDAEGFARFGVVAAADATIASPATAPLYPRQWNMHAVSASEAWAAGHLGSRDVIVAILDTGIDYLHPDLIGLVDIERSISLVPEDDPVIASQYPGRRSISDLHGHGTVGASIVGSNATMVAGITRHVTLLAVKVWDRTATGPIDRVIRGIVYAADHGADVITISGSYALDRSEHHGVITAVQRAVNYAVRNGAVVISIAGNDGADLDRAGSIVRMPCEAANVICASATAPAGAASITGPWEDMDAPAPYAAFGRSAVDVTAPGGFGDFANPNPSIGQFRRIWAPCTTTPTATSLPACARGMPLAQSFGTSWAAPHVAGLAGLLVAQVGHGRPTEIRARILGSADDLGEPGTDPRYGRGRINVARALGLTPP
jgi:subtilisin family serine protease